MTVQVVTICDRQPSEWYYCLSEFYKSLGRTPVTTLNTETMGGELFRGLGTKPKWLYRAIKEGIVRSDIILFTDCWDVIFAADMDEIVDVYLCMDSPLVISAEMNCFPADLKQQYDDLNPPTKYAYLNSGFIMGEKDAFVAALEAMDLDNVPYDYWDNEKSQMVHINDQFMWQEQFIKQPVSMKLDYHQILSQTLHDNKVEYFDFSKPRIKNKLTGTYPCTFHFNGSAKDNMDLRTPIFDKLGYAK